MTLGTELGKISTPTRVRVSNKMGKLTRVYRMRAQGDKIVLESLDGFKLQTVDEVTLVSVDTEKCMLADCPCKAGFIEAKNPKNKELFVIVLNEDIDVEPVEESSTLQ